MYYPQHVQISPTSDTTSPVSLQLVSPEPRLILYLFFASATAMVNVNSTMRRSPTDRDTIQLPTAAAFNICDGLFKMANCLVVGLPEAQLRDVRYALDTLTSKVDRLLESGEYDLSLNFDGLAVDPDIPGAEDFGAPASPSPTASDFGLTSISTTTGTNSRTLTSLSPSPRRQRQNTIRVPAPSISAPTPAPSPAQTSSSVPYHGQFPYVISSRESVGLPDYTHHPLFVRPGIPGAYQNPPTASGLAGHGSYHVICKGLYVGIFQDWNEISPWVIGIAGSIYRKVKTWEEARDVYNARLTGGIVQILR